MCLLRLSTCVSLLLRLVWCIVSFLMVGQGRKLDLKVSSFARLDVASGSQQGWHKMGSNQEPHWSFLPSHACLFVWILLRLAWPSVDVGHTY